MLACLSSDSRRPPRSDDDAVIWYATDDGTLVNLSLAMAVEARAKSSQDTVPERWEVVAYFGGTTGVTSFKTFRLGSYTVEDGARIEVIRLQRTLVFDKDVINIMTGYADDFQLAEAADEWQKAQEAESGVAATTTEAKEIAGQGKPRRGRVAPRSQTLSE